MIKCPACGTDNTNGTNFCIACGVDLNATATEQRVRTDSVASPTPDTPPLSSPSVDMPREYLDNTPPPPRPAPPPPAPPAYTPIVPNYTAAPSAAAPTKDRSLAIILELLAGFFGFMGIGWIYAGNTTVGVVLLIGYWVGTCIAFVLDVITGSIFLCIHLPIIAVALGLSAYFLYNYTKEHSELFGA